MIARLLGARVLVALPPKDETQEPSTGFTYQQEQTTASGLILAKPADVYNVQTATRGLVVQLGEKRGTVDLDDVLAVLDEVQVETAVASVRAAMKRLAPAPFEVEVGDIVVFAPSAGEQFEQDDVQYVILREADVFGILDATKAA